MAPDTSNSTHPPAATAPKVLNAVPKIAGALFQITPLCVHEVVVPM
jgi:hypothetical protein